MAGHKRQLDSLDYFQRACWIIIAVGIVLMVFVGK